MPPAYLLSASACRTTFRTRIDDVHGAAPLVFLVAGEPSGDILGGRLMAGLKALTDGNIRFAGVGGEHMVEQGLDSLFPMADLSLMGLAEILPHLPRLMRRLGQTEAAALHLRPDAVVTIDSPGFTFRLAERLKGRGMALIHYVAPSVWAWKPGRAARIARFLDHLLALLPFEPPYFEREGLACTFVGHPVVESGADKGDGSAFRARYHLDPVAPLVCVLPGSRRGEVARMLPVLGDTLGCLAAGRPGLKAILPTVGTVADTVVATVDAWPVPTEVVRREGEKYDAFAAADVALAASGTVALELAMAGTPTVVGYRMHPLTGWLARRLVKLDWVSLPNILLGREVMPELLLEDCRPERLAAAAIRLLDDPATRRAQREDGRRALEMLGLGWPEPPSRRAAAAVLGVIENRRREASR
jgi:lipid-A-disaccharide synthase